MVPPLEEACLTTHGLVALSYDCISGPAARPRPWERFLGLHAPGARLVCLRSDPGEPLRTEVLSPEEYARSRDPLLRQLDFYETEVTHHATVHGRVAQVFSGYEARLSPDGPVRFAGFNSFQLIWSDGRWWIQSTCWDGTSGHRVLAREGFTV